MTVLLISKLAIFALPALLGLVVKETLLLLAAWGVCLMLCRASAAVRHLIWTAALGGVLLLPLLSLSLPRWNVQYAQVPFSSAALSPAHASAAVSPKAALPRPTARMAQDAGGVRSAAPLLPPQRAEGRRTPASPTAPAQFRRLSSFTPLFFGAGLALWLAGFFAVLAPFFAGLHRIHQIGKQAMPLTGAAAALAHDGRQQLGIRPLVFLQVKPEAAPKNRVAVPVTWGLSRPRVLLPAQAAAWSQECLRAALLHELGHVQRWDWLTQVAALFTCALYWWHPLVWFAAKHARAESERACDDLVLNAGINAANYAQHLIEVVRSMLQAAFPQTVAVSMAQPSEVEGRITAVLTQGRKRSPLSRRKAAAALLTLSLILTPLAVLRPVVQAAVRKASPARGAVGGASKKTAAQAEQGNARAETADPAALRVLTQMAAAYPALQTYSGTEIAEGSGALGMPYEMSFAYERPGRMAADITHHFGGKSMLNHLLLDGKALYVESSDRESSDPAVPGSPVQYTRRTKPESNYSLWQDALIIREDIKFPIIMQMLEGGGDAAKFLTQTAPGTTIRLGPAATVDGVSVDTVVIQSRSVQGRSTGVWQIGHQDHLLRRFTEDSQELHRDPTHMSQTFLNVRANPALPASLFVFAAPAGAVVTDEHPGGAEADPAATALVTQMYAAYNALTSFSCSMEMTVHGPSYGPNGMTIATSPVLSRATYAIQKPYRVLITRTGSAGTARAVSDGTTLYVTTTESSGGHGPPRGIHARPDRYLKLPIQADAGNIAYNLSNFGGIPSYGDGQQDFVPQAILGWNVMPAAGYDWKLGTPAEINGEPVDTVTLRQPFSNNSGYSMMTLAISRRDHLLRRVTTETHQSGQPVEQEFDTFTDVQVNPALPASLFLFTPPPGSRPVPVASQLTASAAVPSTPPAEKATPEQKSLSRMKRISLSLVQYSQDHEGSLPPLGNARLLRNTLDAYLKFQDKVIDPATGEPFGMQTGDTFVSPSPASRIASSLA